MKPTEDQIWEAIRAMSEMIPFFPKEFVSQKIIFQEIECFCGTKEQLDWFCSTACRIFRSWDKDNGNLPNMRGLFCTKFQPADGILQYCTLPGLTHEDSFMAAEQRRFERESSETDRKLAQWKAEALLSGPMEPIYLPAPKKLEPATPVVIETKQSLADRERELREQMKPFRSHEDNRQLVAEIEEALGRANAAKSKDGDSRGEPQNKKETIQ